MNCREFHSHLEEYGEQVSRSDSPDFAEHVAICGDCTQWLAAQNSIRVSLDLLRQSVPGVPASLDAAVLATYRNRMAERKATVSVAMWRKMFPLSLRLGVAVAAVLLIAAAIFALRRPVVTTANKPQLQLVPPGVTPVVQAKASVPNHQNSIVVRKGHASRRNPTITDRGMTTTASAIHHSGFPDGFRSLMYCDELICEGGMEVVRVQFSPGAIGLNAASTSPNRVVYADVLVGSDGFARGIRIER